MSIQCVSVSLRNTMKSLLLLGCLIQAGVAHGATYYFCAVYDTHVERKLYYYSDILFTEMKNIDKVATLVAFRSENERRKRQDYPMATLTSGHCVKDDNLARLEKDYQKFLKDYSAGRKYPFKNPPVPSKPYQPPTSSGVIIVEDAKPVAPSREQLVKQAAEEREVAAKQARMAATRAKHDAKVRAMIEEQLRLRREQGARQ